VISKVTACVWLLAPVGRGAVTPSVEAVGQDDLDDRRDCLLAVDEQERGVFPPSKDLVRPKLAVVTVSGCHPVLVIYVGDALLAEQGPRALVADVAAGRPLYFGYSELNRRR
jgi:hypothetical protein